MNYGVMLHQLPSSVFKNMLHIYHLPGEVVLPLLLCVVYNTPFYLKYLVSM